MSNYGDITLIQEMNEMRGRLDNALKQLQKSGRELAEAERDYKVALASKALELKQQGMAIGMIDKVIYGLVSDERFQRDLAESMHETAKEGINVLKLNMKILDAQIQREWGANG